ncbi:LysR family transcriptional regulator [Tardiphaga alba]|uniref:LysR family transcriptional regulator n=1 Tax=Tardiphaga alba TaxID=340268 RepID=A0ABX8A4E1_9BRAD|nr:LysR family transcriptional regulator [Tardiphaga alba]QUS38543.1 LysR family transcriptional regulator [Tardiphaga alba]
MDWDNIRVFLAVARGGHFSAAASTLQMDNATVGRRVIALEKSLGCRLFDRRPTGSVLTEAGERLLASAEAIESNLLRAQRDLSQSESDLAGTVRIAAPDGFGTLFLCPLLADLKRQYPTLTIQLVPISRTLSLSKREADLAIMIDRPDEGRLSIRRLIDYSLHFYATRDYLDRHPQPQTIDDLSAHSVVTYVQDLLFADRLNFVPQLYRPEYSRFECATAMGQMAAVRAGAGIGILHDYAVHDDPVFEMVLPDVSFTRSYWMATHLDVVGLNRVQTVANFIASGLTARASIFRRTRPDAETT